MRVTGIFSSITSLMDGVLRVGVRALCKALGVQDISASDISRAIYVLGRSWQE